MNKLDKILLILGISTVLFVIAMIVIFCLFQSIPDSLVVGYFGAVFGEVSACSWIKKVKEDRRKEELKLKGIEMEEEL